MAQGRCSSFQEGNKTDSGRDVLLPCFDFPAFFFFCIIHATFYSRFLLDASLVVKGNYFCPITNSIKVKVCLPSFVGKSFFSFPHLLYSLSLSLLSLFFQFSPLDFSFLLFRLFFLLFLFSFSFFFSSFLIIWPTKRQMNYLERRVEQDLL